MALIWSKLIAEAPDFPMPQQSYRCGNRSVLFSDSIF
jgi:hypothetical protein